MDVIAAHESDNDFEWYENNGAADPNFQTHTIDADAGGAMSVYAADIDNDGDMDVIAGAQGEDRVYWYENDGSADPSFSSNTITSSADGIYSVYAKDVDSDGDIDILSASAGDDKIAWYKNKVFTTCDFNPLDFSYSRIVRIFNLYTLQSFSAPDALRLT